MNSPIRKRFSVLGFFSALAATGILALAVTLFIIWTEGLRSLPNLPLMILLTVPAVASYFGWSYFVTGRNAHGWIVTALFAGAGIPMIILGIIETLNPPQRHEMVTLEVSHVAFATICCIPVLLSFGLARELRKEGLTTSPKSLPAVAPVVITPPILRLHFHCG